MFGEASEADMGLRFAEVAEELFDAAAPAAATRGCLPTGPEDPPAYFGVAPSRRVGQASDDRRSAQEWRTCRRLHR
jgi:hypothetical protein